MTEERAVGLACFALWRSGVPFTDLAAFVADTQGPRPLAVTIASWMVLDGGRVQDVSEAALHLTCNPPHPLHALAGMDERGITRIDIMFTRDRKDAEAACACLREAGQIVGIIDMGYYPVNPPFFRIEPYPSDAPVREPGGTSFEETWLMTMTPIFRSGSNAVCIHANATISPAIKKIVIEAAATGLFVVISGLDEDARKTLSSDLREVRDDVIVLDMADREPAGVSLPCGF